MATSLKLNDAVKVKNYEHRTSNRHYPQVAEDDTEGTGRALRHVAERACEYRKEPLAAANGNYEAVAGSTWCAAVVHLTLQHRGLRHPRRQVENGKASADTIEGLFIKREFLIWTYQRLKKAMKDE